MMDVDLLSVNRGFSRQASSFDEEDASNPILQWMRGRVRAHVSRFLSPSDKILEINAGTGLDAVYFTQQDHRVHASDLSDGMIDEIKRKIEAYDLHGRLSFQQISFRDLDQVENAPFDYVFSNFGGLNCIHDLREVSRHVGPVLNPGAHLTLVIMPRICPWEIGLVFRGNFKRAFRRLRRSGSLAHLEGQRFMTYYFSPAEVQRAFGPDFKMVALEGLGSFCPPPHRKEFSKKYPDVFRTLTRADEVLSRSYPFDRWADHYIITLRYLPGAGEEGSGTKEGRSARYRQRTSSRAMIALHQSPLAIRPPAPAPRPVFHFFKSVFDFTFSLLFCVFILSWLVPLLALLIKMDSKGPVFFLQKRTGLNSKEFYCIKLRTMHVNDKSDCKQATHQDSRITRFGHFLRNTNLDELPQFINVLKGDMSVIGPRPHMTHHTDEFAKKINHYHTRHQVKPGITGLAQVKGWRGPTPTLRTIYKRVQWDIFYIKHQGLRLDIYILMTTFKEVFSNFWNEVFK